MEYNFKKHSIAANVWHFLCFTWQHYKLVLVFFLAQVIFGALLPLFGLYLPRLAVDLVINYRGLAETMAVLGLFAGAYVFVQLLDTLCRNARYPFQNVIRSVFLKKMFFKAMECDYPIMESSRGQTWYHKARASIMNGDNSVTYQMLNPVQSLVSGTVSFAFLIGILSMLSIPIVFMLFALSILSFYIDSFPRKFVEIHRDENAGIDRKLAYVENMMSNISAAKDIRIYNLSGLLNDVKGKTFAHMFALTRKTNNRYFTAETLKQLLGLIRDGVAYAFCIWQVLSGNIGVPDFVLYMAAIGAFSGWLGGILDNFNTLKRENVRANELRAFFDFTNQMEPKSPTPIGELKPPLSIEFRNVSFRYTGDSPPVLHELNFKINPKEKVALVGVNGAGKTTIVKLLCGFYKAGEGEILINGHNINNFNRADLCTLFSAVFQDITILPMTVAENVAMKRPEEIDDKKLHDCLEKAGINEAVMAHKNGINAYMTKIVDEEGLVLSGGQEQKLTIARALYKDAPFLLLDEPTAALDPIAESEVYESFHSLTKDKTALYISHRLASTRFCDKIIMLGGGRITETGNHDELMAKAGEYAKMYEIQSHYYKSGEVSK